MFYVAQEDTISDHFLIITAHSNEILFVLLSWLQSQAHPYETNALLRAGTVVAVAKAPEHRHSQILL